MITSMAPKTGRLAVVLPHGALFRMGAEGKIRSKVLDMDLIEAVIGLGPNLFYGTGLAACIVVARRTQEPRSSGKDPAGRWIRPVPTRAATRTLLSPSTSANSDRLIRGFADLDGRSRVVSLDEIAEQEGNLNLAGYVTKVDDGAHPDAWPKPLPHCERRWSSMGSRRASSMTLLSRAGNRMSERISQSAARVLSLGSGDAPTGHH